MGTEPESVYGQKGTMQDVLVRCLKKTEAQVRTVRYSHGGGESRKINAWHIYTLMVYL